VHLVPQGSEALAELQDVALHAANAWIKEVTDHQQALLLRRAITH